MKKLIVAGVFLSLTGPAMAQEGARAADHDALRKLKADVVDAINSRNIPAADALLHKPFMATVVTQDNFTEFDKLKSYYDSLYTREYPRIKSITMKADADDLSKIYEGTFAVNLGPTVELYELADGRRFEIHGRWTAVSIKENGGWKVLAVHTGTNFLDNPVINGIENSVRWFGAIGAVLGLLCGLVAGWFARRQFVRAS